MKNKLLHFIIIAVLLCYPKIDFGQAPTLGTTANFVLFTSSGAVTNTGISQVTGHVGSNVGAATNFGNVNGVMQSQNAATAACSADLLTLYNELAAKTANFFPSSSLGGDTLLAGVYSITGASTLTNTLTLNAQGNPNAIFIFKLQGAFSAAANAKVKLINGAKACNVFWKIDGLVSVATGVTMRGTIIANNAAISMSAGDTLEGRAMSTAGAISVNGIMAYTPIGCGSPFLTGPNAPPLGTTANYVLFTGIGAVTNTGITHATGDIGSNSALTTGFNPLFINGMIHPIPDASTNQCDADLAVVYNYLNALTPDIELLYPAQFGRNLVLTPHTYILNAATTLTDTLVLNGQGNPNAVFVIKIYGALSTSTYSNIVLTNGTKSSNVFWLVSGAVSINDYSVFRGTIIGHNGAISLTTGCTLDGRALTNIGAVSVSAINAVAPNAPSVIIPPASKLVCIGDTARFIVAATGTNLTYQWRKGNLNLVNSSTISGVTNDTLTIFPVSFADTASTYNVIIMGNVSPNDTTAAVSLRINSTEITTEPSNQTACIGNNVVFTVKTIGTGISYQWRKGTLNLVNGGNIQGVTSDSLKINGITLSDIAANYNVIVTGTCSPRDTSNNAALNIVTTVINTQPSNQTSCLGNTATFIIRATGSGLTYQWRKGNVNLINGGNISGATSDTLRFNPSSISDTASNYNVIISSACSAKDTSANVSLNINLPLVININPTNQTICSGTAISFVTRATGSGLTYQWRKGNVNLINGGNISGVTSDTLRFNPSSIADTSSNYNVIISSACSARDTSANVSLNINMPLVVNINPTNQTICSGTSVSFVTRATGSGLTYQWRKGNVNLINGGNISGVTSDTLRFNPSSIADTASNYNVIISSTCSTRDTSSNVSLNINLPLVVTTNPTNQTICSGTAVSFVTRATGSGLTYQWRKGNVNLVNGGNISGVTSDTLRFNPSSIADVANNYNVIISSACSTRDTSANVSLNINLPLVVNINPTNQTICSGTAVSFVTRATGSGLTYQWRKGNLNLVNGGNISGATSDTLRFNPSSIADVATNYNVIISSVCSTRDTSANVSLNINLPLVVNINPTNQTICSGTSVSFVTRATGSGLTYQWRKGNVNLINGGNISGATSDTLRFNPSSIADVATNYNVIISSVCSAKDTSANVSLNINLPLVVNINPTNKTICSGTSVSFVTRATGSGLTYQWRKGNVNLVNGGNISGATNDTLRFNPSSITDIANNYNVIISSTCSAKDTSANVSLNINLPLVVTINPTNQTICSGTSVSFVTRATGSGLTYQWRKGNVNLINGGNISGATSDTLRFNPSSIADVSNNYNVIISSTCSARDTSANVSLNINLPLVVNINPTNQTICSGTSVSFVTRATGSGLTYQWRKGNVNLINGGNISGATSDTLRFNSTTIADTASNYNVIISGSCSAKDTSNNVSLNINLPIVLNINPTNQTICSGNIVSFVTRATGSGLTYQWRKGNVNLVNGGNILGATSDTLRFNPSSIADTASNYNVIISSTCSAKDTSNNVSLNINLPLVININPTNQTICSGSAVSFVTRATGSGLTYQWRKGNVNLVNGGNISGVTSDTLRFNPSSVADVANNYNVIISSTCSAKDTSANVSLNINLPLVININPTNQTICSGTSVSFVTRATGSGLTYQWRKGNVNLINGGNISGATNDTLKFSTATIADASNNYNVIISSVCSARDTSNNVSLQLYSPALILTEPGDQTVCIGGSTNFSVTASGAGLSYQWRKGNVNLANVGNTSGVSTAMLTISPVSILDASNDYNVIITGTICPSSDTSANVALLVSTPSLITSQPTNKTTCEGTSVSFTVNASGSSTTYQWRKGLINLINGGNISGASSNTLTLNNASSSDADMNYNVVITGTCSSTETSTNVSLSVNQLPIAVATYNSAVCVGKSINLYAQTVVGASYNWTGPNAFSSTIQNPVIVAAVLADSGFYTLIVTQNLCSSNPSIVKVDVKECLISELNIPEGFSPNGDGINDLYVIRGIENYSKNTLQVFNRWGNLVFEASPYQNTWNGNSTSGITVGGNELPVGVYFYVLDLGDNSGVKKGTIYLNK